MRRWRVDIPVEGREPWTFLVYARTEDVAVEEGLRRFESISGYAADPSTVRAKRLAQPVWVPDTREEVGDR